MRHLMSFEHKDEDSGDLWRYQICHLDTQGEVLLWYCEHQVHGSWEIGHSKEIPAGSTPENVANLMRLFIQGELTSETYNQILPR